MVDQCMDSELDLPLLGLPDCPVDVGDVARSGLSGRDHKEAEGDGDVGVLSSFSEVPPRVILGPQV
jgi:hypothetical protein